MFSELDGKTWYIAGPVAGSSYSNSTIHNIATADASMNYLSKDHIDYKETKGISHKVFTHFSYNWYENEDWIPYLGLGGEVEFGPSCSNNDSDASCSTSSNDCNCINTAASTWGIWVKGGFSF